MNIAAVIKIIFHCYCRWKLLRQRTSTDAPAADVSTGYFKCNEQTSASYLSINAKPEKSYLSAVNLFDCFLSSQTLLVIVDLRYFLFVKSISHLIEYKNVNPNYKFLPFMKVLNRRADRYSPKLFVHIYNNTNYYRRKSMVSWWFIERKSYSLHNTAMNIVIILWFVEAAYLLTMKTLYW